MQSHSLNQSFPDTGTGDSESPLWTHCELFVLSLELGGTSTAGLRVKKLLGSSLTLSFVIGLRGICQQPSQMQKLMFLDD